MAGIWTRDTPWRQGHVLTADATQQLKLLHSEAPADTCVVVVSHDCDLANHNLEIEPDVELIIGRHVPTGNGNCYWAKAPRTLHVDALLEHSPVTIELVATAKRSIPKQLLATFTPNTSYSFSARSLATLRSWLGVRYHRAAFPDPFITRLSSFKVDKGIAKLIEPLQNLISAIYFDVDKGVEIDRPSNEPYELTIVLLYFPGDNPEDTADRIHELATAIETLFAKKYFNEATEKWSGIALLGCLPISEDDLTVGKAKLLTEWRLEHMSLRTIED